MGQEIHELATAPDHPFVLGVVLRLRARLALRASTRGEARRRLDEARPLFEKAATPLELGRTLRLWAQRLAESGKTDRSAEILRQAHDVPSRMGATVEARRVGAKLGELWSPTASARPVEGHGRGGVRDGSMERRRRPFAS